MTQAPTSPFTEKLAVDTHAYSLRAHPTVSLTSDTSSPPTCQDVPEHDAPISGCPERKYLPSTRCIVAFLTLVFGTMLITLWCLSYLEKLNTKHHPAKHGTLIESDQELTYMSIQNTASGESISKHELVKRMDGGFMDNMMLWVLLGGIGIALVCGLSMSWWLQRKQFGPRRRRDERGNIQRTGGVYA